jgi:hypothetical protein
MSEVNRTKAIEALKKAEKKLNFAHDVLDKIKKELNMPLRQILKNLGFKDVTGMTETRYVTLLGIKTPDSSFIGCKSHNNGIIAVIDYELHIWVQRHAHITTQLNVMHELNLLLLPPVEYKRFHVPHSNDGGEWVRKNLPHPKDL